MDKVQKPLLQIIKHRRQNPLDFNYFWLMDFIFNSLNLYQLVDDQVSSSCEASDLYSGGMWFESRPRPRLSSLKFFLFFLSTSRWMSGLPSGFACSNAGLLDRSQCSSGRSCDRPTRSRFSSVLEQVLCWYPNSTLHCMPLMQTVHETEWSLTELFCAKLPTKPADKICFFSRKMHVWLDLC
jgi:hypothetical protein